jgi:hypothetical protein
MKKTIYAVAISILFLSACKNTNKQENSMNKNLGMKMDATSKSMSKGNAMLKDSKVQNTSETNKISKEYTATQKNEATTPIIDAYLALKNALTNDDKNGASKSATSLLNAFSNFDMSKLTETQHKEYMEIIEDAKEQTEHIAKSPLEHQREHFESLSIDINDLITLLGTDKTLYQYFCPMAGEGNGAIWLSETKKISNPYLGHKMPTCGTVQKQFN